MVLEILKLGIVEAPHRKKMKQALIIIGRLLCFITLISVLFFRQSSISNTPNDWQIFAAYFSGTTGTIGSMVAGDFLYWTLILHISRKAIQTTLL